jgi:hypothetical protein
MMPPQNTGQFAMLSNEPVSRRTFAKQTLGSLLTYSILETLFERDLFADEVRPLTTAWLRDANELGRAVQNQTLHHVEWQQKIEELFARVNLPELLSFIDMDRLASVPLLDRGARHLSFEFPKVEGMPTDLVFGKQVFALKKGRSVVPHGHNNMATAFLVLKGDLRGRHYDRLEDVEDAFIIRPTIDRTFSPSDCSTISDYKDNIHWFEAATESAYLFNIHVYDVSPGFGYPSGRVYVNPNGEKLADGLVRAPRINYETALRLFG